MKLLKNAFGFATLALLMAISGQATATIITFSEAGATTGSSFLSSDGLVLAEWVWTTGAADGHNHIQATGGNPGAFERGHGQNFQGLRFSNVGGGLITLTSFDMAGNWWVNSLNDGTGTSFTSTSGVWTTQISGFSATPYVYISANQVSGSFDNWLDNVNLNGSVPEPSILALFGLGLLGLGFARRRKA